METLLGGLGGIVLFLIGIFVLKKGRPGSTDNRVPPPTQAPGHLESAARREAARRAEEAKARAELNEIDGRPHTGDAVSDLEARLGYTRPHRPDGDSTGEPPAPGDSSD